MSTLAVNVLHLVSTVLSINMWYAEEHWNIIGMKYCCFTQYSFSTIFCINGIIQVLFGPLLLLLQYVMLLEYISDALTCKQYFNVTAGGGGDQVIYLTHFTAG